VSILVESVKQIDIIKVELAKMKAKETGKNKGGNL
jgi:hypothetical protein